MEKSVILFNILDKIGASEKIRHLYREKAKTYEILGRIRYRCNSTVYIFGSMAEGTTTPGLKSDFDMVSCNESVPVVLNIEDAPIEGYAALLTSDSGSPPGYVKLQIVNDGLVTIYNIPFIDALEDYGIIKQDMRNIYCWKNISSLSQVGTAFENGVRGPAITFTHHSLVSSDNVYSLQCKQWPSFATEWIIRQRRYSWPDQGVIDQCQKLGFLVVKVGHPYSEENDIEWRVSFSLQERLLMSNLNEVQHKCYVMLKLIKKDLIQENIGKSITSYHCKTCILYTIEQNPQNIWHPKNLFQCVVTCLKTLLYWTREGYCPNYFIPDQNMFDGKITGNTRIQVIDVLEHIMAEGESFLTRIETDKIGKYFMSRNNKNALEIFENMFEEATLLVICKLHTTNIHFSLNVISYLLNKSVSQNGRKSRTEEDEARTEVLHAIEDHLELIDWLYNIESIRDYTVAETRYLLDPIFPFLHSSLACHLLCFSLQCEDIVLRNNYLSLSYERFQNSIASDVASGRLKYITSLYIRGKYDMCEQELISLEKQFNSPLITVSPCRGYEIHTSLKLKLKKHKYTSRYIFQHYVSACVIFLPTELEIIPYALQFEMFRSTGTTSRDEIGECWHDWVVVESKVYMYFLWYLLARKMNVSQEERRVKVAKLKSSADVSGLHGETALNILSWVLTLENYIPQAMQCLVLSWGNLRSTNLKVFQNVNQVMQRMPQNAAKWHMVLLLKQLWFSQSSFDNDYRKTICCFKCFKQSVCEMKKCSKCKIALYCSRKCQQIDWNVHKNICDDLE